MYPGSVFFLAREKILRMWYTRGMDIGPVARFEAVKARVDTASVVFQRLTEGETLKSIARDWEVPVGRFTEWFTTEHGDLYDGALKVRADQLAHEALERADAADEDTVGQARLQVDTRLKLASKWDRGRYGEQLKVDRTVTVTADAGLVGLAGALLERISKAERVVLPAPESDVDDAPI